MPLEQLKGTQVLSLPSLFVPVGLVLPPAAQELQSATHAASTPGLAGQKNSPGTLESQRKAVLTWHTLSVVAARPLGVNVLPLQPPQSAVQASSVAQ